MLTENGRKQGEASPLGRVVEPQEVASLVAFLLSGDSSYITVLESP